MRRSVIILMVAILVTLSGCTEDKFPKSDDEIQADCLEIQAIQSNLVELVSFAIDSRSFNGEYFIVKTKIDLLTDQEEVKADVVMKYKKQNNTWVVESSEIIITAVLSPQLPSESLVRSVLKGQDLLPYQYGRGVVDQNAMTINLEQNFEDGTIAYHFAQDGSNLIWSWKNEGTVLLTYDLNKQWVPSIQDQTYTETMDWNGIYRMDFYTTPGTDMPEPIVITITGTLTQNADTQGNETVSGILMGKFTIDGYDYLVEGKIDRVTENQYKPNTRRIRFVYGSDNEALTMYVSFYEDPINTYYEGNALGSDGVVYKLD
jgi:hypothetical protein